MIKMFVTFLVAMATVLILFFAYQNHTISVQTGYRGTGQFVLYQPKALPASLLLICQRSVRSMRTCRS